MGQIALTLMNVHVDTVPQQLIAQTFLAAGCVIAMMDLVVMVLPVQV